MTEDYSMEIGEVLISKKELATLRKFDARKPEVQAKVIKAAANYYEYELPGDKMEGEIRWLAAQIHTGKRPALKLEGM